MFPGWTVFRAIPPATWVGLLGGAMKAHGGVIRWAPGTKHAGQIVSHLIPAFTGGMVPSNLVGGIVGAIAPGIIGDMLSPGQGTNVPGAGMANVSGLPFADILNTLNTFQLADMQWTIHHLTSLTNQVLRVSQATMALSGLNLVVSAVGFTVLHKKLTAIENNLKDVAKDVKAIRAFLERKERAELRVALRDLSSIDDVTNSSNRHTLLHSARHTFALQYENYMELLANATVLEDSVGIEEYVCLTALCLARCQAELDMVDIASKDLNQAVAMWRQHVQRIAKTWLLEKHPRWFLYRDFVDHVPTATLIEWLDFVEGTNKGMAWMDDMRKTNPRWYRESPMETPEIDRTDLFGIGLKNELQVNVPCMHKIMARNNLFHGYQGQYELMVQQNLSMAEFMRVLKQLIVEMELVEDEYIILMPEPVAA